MPQYKKKNVRKHHKTAKNIITEDVIMQRAKTPISPKKHTVQNTVNSPQRKKISVIQGNKYKRRTRRAATLGICLLLAVIVFVISLITPTGIAETFVNISASIKFGNSFPVKLSGGTLVNTIPQGNHMFLVSTTNFECYNNNGKNIFSYQHGYQSPILSVSESRSLLYDQAGKNYSIYNLNAKVLSATAENEILAANICKNGTFTIATLSDSYSSQVAVYNKRGQKIYEWFCSDYIINDVILSPDGNSLAVSAITASNGVFVSKLYILEFNSATPKASYDYNGLVLGLSKSGNAGFSCISENSADFFTWKKQKCNTFLTDDSILISRNYKSNTLVVTGREANKNDNTLTVFDSLGNVKHKFKFNGIINSIEYKDTDVYILSENNVYKYNLNGEHLGVAPCEFGTQYIVLVSQKEIAAIADNNIQKITF